VVERRCEDLGPLIEFVVPEGVNVVAGHRHELEDGLTFVRMEVAVHQIVTGRDHDDAARALSDNFANAGSEPSDSSHLDRFEYPITIVVRLAGDRFKQSLQISCANDRKFVRLRRVCACCE